MADETTQDSLRQAINRILGFSPGSAGTGTSSGVSAPMEGPKYSTAEEAIKTAGQTPFSNISGVTGQTAGTTPALGTPGTTGTINTTSAKSQRQLDFEAKQKEYEADPGYQAALKQAIAPGGSGSVWRTNAPGPYVVTSTPNAMGGYSMRSAPGPNVWSAWQAGKPPPMVSGEQRWADSVAASNAALAAEYKRLGINAPRINTPTNYVVPKPMGYSEARRQEMMHGSPFLLNPGRGSSLFSGRSSSSTPNYPGSGTWQQKAQYWKNLAARR
jgi:hypothetical protein